MQLHAKEIYVSAANFKDASGKVSEAVEIGTNLKDNVVSIKFSEDLSPGPGALTITFAGQINNQMAGIINTASLYYILWLSSSFFNVDLWFLF